MFGIHEAYYQSPIGSIKVAAGVLGVREISFTDATDFGINRDAPEYLMDALFQLDAYFSKKRRVFDLKLDMEGTDFQKKVWYELLKIPLGHNITYQDVAKRMGCENMTRAIANAIAKNPVLIVVPCHRVIGSDGKLTGYSGGLPRKKWLLEFESLQQSILF